MRLFIPELRRAKIFGPLVKIALCLAVVSMAPAQEPPVGASPIDQERNARLLNGYDYNKYTVAITGYNGQDLQRVGFVDWQHAVRTRVTARGTYKAGMAQLPNGRLVLAACRDNYEEDRAKRGFTIEVYESADEGLTWTEIGESPLFGKEPSLTALPDGSLVLTAQDFGPGATHDRIPISRSSDGGRTWQTIELMGPDYPRNVIVEPDGSLLFVRALEWDWEGEEGSHNLQLCRSKDGGETWTCSEGQVDWDVAAFGEVSAIRLKDGRYMAALRTIVPDAPARDGHGFGVTVLTESTDGGKYWSKPRPITSTAEVHAYLTELDDGRLMVTYSTYHLPFGVFAMVSSDGGKTWSRDRPAQLALSALNNVGWPVTLQLKDGSLLTAYALTAYLKQPPDRFVTEVVRWRWPAE